MEQEIAIESEQTAEYSISERKKKAAELNIGLYAGKIAEIFGEEYHSIHTFDGGGLAGDSSTSEFGKRFDDGFIKIESGRNQDKIGFVRIYNHTKKQKRFLGFKFNLYTPECVYHDSSKNEGEREILMFREENKWLNDLTRLYALANESINNKKSAKTLERITENEENFGLR